MRHQKRLIYKKSTYKKKSKRKKSKFRKFFNKNKDFIAITLVILWEIIKGLLL